MSNLPIQTVMNKILWKKDKPAKIRKNGGYTLIELIIVMVIIAVLATVAVKSLSSANQTARIEETKMQLDRLAFAIAGNPELISGGSRTDFGYLGDVGSLPVNLDGLLSNPGGYTTWQGPYITDEFSVDGSSSQFKIDAWGATYSYSGSHMISSTGGPTTMTRLLANSSADLLYNMVSLVVVDLDRTPPGPDHRDSVQFILLYPDGSGAIAGITKSPGSDGSVQFDSLPVGSHQLHIVYLPTADTLTRKISIEPGRDYYTEVVLPQNYWQGGS